MHSYIVPDYICYDGKLCDDNLFSIVLRPAIDLFGNNSTCRSFNEFAYQNITFIKWRDVMNYFYDLFRKCSTYHQPLSSLDNSNLYQCMNSSKIISQHRLVDGIEDCLYGDDESYTESCSLQNFNHRFKCDQGKDIKCLARSRVSDKQKDCLDGSDEPKKAQQSAETEIAFQTLCDGYTELLFPIMIDGQNETDETDCMHFSCNNTYTRCDGFWNCPDGADEINCEWPPMCPPLHHMCLSPVSGDLTCLHIEHVNDGVIDCLGAYDERQNCRDLDSSTPALRYQCWNTSRCVGYSAVCLDPDQCSSDINIRMSLCQDMSSLIFNECSSEMNFTHVQQLICTLTDLGKMTTVHFSLIGLTSYEFLKMPDSYSKRTTAVIADAEINDDFFADNFNIAVYCNRGLMVRRSTDNKNNTEAVCLCPPAYYGHLCQFQNQRVSLTMQIRASFDVRIPFAIIITLRDDQQNLIESHDQINYLYEHDCLKKFNIYLLYATRPKNTSTNYSVHIHILNKESLEYRASYLYPIKFSFLPVYRLAVRLHIPPTEIIIQNCETLNCGMHGRCSQYVNTKTVFCLCHKGWSGLYCDLPHPCHHCSSDSFCFGPNICVCPLEKFGPRCYLKHSTCSCMNNGTCISSDERAGEKKAPWCRCPERFSGPKCETLETTITLSFTSKIPIPSSIHVHFIEVFGKNQSHIRSTTLKKIPIDQESVTISRSIPFHLVFIEIEQSKRYYLSIIQQAFVPSANISTSLKHSDHCPSINDLLNETILSWHLLRRMKYYHIPCQERINLTCFHDEKHLCICNQDLRQANCLTFNHNQPYDCEEQNPCENQGRCFRDSPSCPITFMCICDDCSYGSRCQFSTKGFGLSLDVILGYHIQPNLSLKEQRAVIHVTIVVITLMVILGLVGGIPSIFTFHTKKVREVGCGYYLLASSYTSVITIMMFALKFYFLLVSQMGMITNHHYLTFNCIFFEFLLKVLLSTSDWLNAFVGIERAITVVKDTKFNKTKSKRIAKWAIICICIVTITTHVHDPIYRRMIDDTEEHRTWCHVQFSSSVQLFNFIILGFHFILPFISNISSALIIIINTARQRSIAQKQHSDQHQLREQFSKLKHLLISPVILILLALPRLIISSLSGCMKTTRGNPWLYLSGYLISYLPPMLLALVFIWPSETYKTEFKKIVTRIQRYIRRDHF